VSHGDEKRPPGEACARAERRISSLELFSGHSRVIVVHNGAEYLLQQTRQGKLILTK
jgi:hemin uptake protein HemP